MFKKYSRYYGIIADVINDRPVAKSEARSVLELLDSDSELRDSLETTFIASPQTIRKKLEEASKRPSVATRRRK